jgi:hypothetical protein
MQEATWIWRTALTDPQYEYANVPDGGWQFMKELTPAGAFDISAGSIYVGADNSEAVYVNGDLILQDGSLDKTGSNPVSPYVDNQEWKTIESADISGSLVDGQNTLVIKALNYFDSTHHPNVAYDYGDGMKNPAGLVFKVHVCYHLLADRMESAWGSGPGFPGKDWSMYMVYAPDETTVQGSGVWLATDYEGHPGTFSSDVTENGVPEPSQDLDDKLILQARGGYDERYYNDPLSPTGHPQMWQANHGIWYDRDGVDQWQAASWGFKGDNLGCKETLGIYHVVITLHADTLTTGTASMTVNGVHQGFYNSWSSPIPDVYPADLSWNGDMQHLVVFYGMYGYGLSDDVEPQWATFSGITVTQVSL